MAHGAPDWGNYRPLSTVYALHDMAELAVRLGSIVTHDRRGDVIFLDDFESGLGKWQTTLGGTGAAVVTRLITSRSEITSVKLTSGNSTGDETVIYHDMPYPALSAIGVEFSFTVHANLGEVAGGFDLYDGTYRNIVRWIYHPATEILAYLDAAGAEITVASGLALYENDYCFHTAKIVADMTTKKYVRLIMDDVEHSLAGIAIEQAANAAAPTLSALASIQAGTDANTSGYIDDAIVTQNEP